jgi:hypothetical protein
MQQSRPRGSALSIGLPIATAATAIAVFTADWVTDLVALAVPVRARYCGEPGGPTTPT